VRGACAGQAHVGRNSLPIADYYTDLRSVLEQSPRVTQVRLLKAKSQYLTSNLQFTLQYHCALQYNLQCLEPTALDHGGVPVCY
jgi:hypothetical protein